MPTSTPPPCRAVGAQCRELAVTLRVATEDGTGRASVDHEATWLLGHTERIAFGPLVRRGRDLLARARLAVPCRYARIDGQRIRCRAHRFSGVVPVRTERRVSRQLGENRFELVQLGRLEPTTLAPPPTPPRALPVAANPCATARCRTADHRIGAACCRDLQVEILCRPGNRRLEALVRSRQSPFLCKVTRESPDSLGAEMISACSFLLPGTSLCNLHGRLRADGRTAKPDLCFDWPQADSTYHPGCAFAPHR